MGLKFTMETLPGIESVLTHFNQIVIRQVHINSYTFCFDLPVNQLNQRLSEHTPSSISVSDMDQLSNFTDQSEPINLNTPIYTKPTDPNEYANLDRFIESALIKSFNPEFLQQISVFGIRVQLTHESTNQQETQIYVPSLSSLYVSRDDQFVDYHEQQPLFNRLPLNTKFQELITSLDDKWQETSYLSVLWTCQRGSDQTSFLIVQKLVSAQVIGLVPIGMQRESFWTSPSHLLTFNSMQGQLYDQICDANIMLLEDLKERGISFLREQLCDGVDMRLV